MNCDFSYFLQVDWEDEKNCFQSLAAALGNFYAMHPPLLPNPLGEGLEFYKKRKHGKNPQDVGNSSSHIGMYESHCICFSRG